MKKSILSGEINKDCVIVHLINKSWQGVNCILSSKAITDEYFTYLWRYSTHKGILLSVGSVENSIQFVTVYVVFGQLFFDFRCHEYQYWFRLSVLCVQVFVRFVFLVVLRFRQLDRLKIQPLTDTHTKKNINRLIYGEHIFPFLYRVAFSLSLSHSLYKTLNEIDVVYAVVSNGLPIWICIVVDGSVGSSTFQSSQPGRKRKKGAQLSTGKLGNRRFTVHTRP